MAGQVAGDAAQGGAAWAVMQYCLGLRKLGHDVCLVEPAAGASAESRGYFQEVVQRFHVRGRLLDEPQAFKGFDVVLNVSGILPADSIAAIPVRVYLDLDPAFNQMWHAQGIDRGFSGHTHFVTVGQAIGRNGCMVPTHGLDWIGTLPPVFLDEWPPAGPVSLDAFTTVANLRSYGPIEHEGVRYGQKVHSLRGLSDLPRRAGDRFVIAMAVHSDDGRDQEALEAGGWELVDPDFVTQTPDAYRCFVQSSRGEIGIAKSGYVASRCGWFSDRSACYLASGRPVVMQETGFSEYLPVGEGLLTFSNLESAVDAVDELSRDPSRHAQAARAIAEQYFDSERVLSRLLRSVCA